MRRGLGLAAVSAAMLMTCTGTVLGQDPAVPPPTWSDPPSTFVDGSQLAHGRVAMSLAWSVSDAPCSSELQRSWRGGPFRSVPTTSTTSATYREPVAFTPAYRVRSRSCDGAVSGWSLGRWGPIHRLQEDDPSLSYAGEWRLATAPEDSWHHARFTRQDGASVALTLPANTTDWVVALVVTTGPRRGSIVETDICGGSFTVDLYSATRRSRVVKAVPLACPLEGPEAPITFTAVTTPERPLVNIDAVLRVP